MPALAFVALSLASSAAQAGPPEFIESLAQHPTDSKRLVLHYDGAYGGLLYSSDGGKTFGIHPSLSFTQSGLYREHAAVSILADNTLVVGAPWDGLFVSDVKGCIKPQDLPYAGGVADVAAHPVDKSVAFFVGNRTSDSRVGLWKRDASGTITQLGVDDGATFRPQGLAVLTRAESTEQLRFVEVGEREDGAKDVVRYSDDLGQTWTEHPIPVADGLPGTPRLLSATGGSVVKLVVALVRDTATEPLDPIVVSVDSGKTFAPYLDTVHKAGQALVAPDGKFYLSDVGSSASEGGLWVAAEVGAPLTKVADYSVHCLGYDKGSEQLYVCKGYELGHFDPASHAYCRIYQLNETASFLCDLATFPKFKESDQLSIAERVKQQQLCSGWCGASHYASTPFCSAYNDPKIICGVSARAYDAMGGTSGRWIEPPGSVEPRCTGYEVASHDAGVSDDAGAAAVDAGVAHDAATADAAGSAEEDAAVVRPDKKGGDSCSIQHGARGGSLLWLGVLSALAALRLSWLARARNRALPRRVRS